jgi:hypothetical protein
MPQYIMLVNFTDQGLKGVKDVPNRQDKSRETAKQFGVERKTVWMTFGPYDFVHHYEAPNDEAINWLCGGPSHDEGPPAKGETRLLGWANDPSKNSRPKVPLDHFSATVEVCPALKESTMARTGRLP